MAAAKIKLGLQKELRLGNLYAKRDWGYAKEFVEAMWLMLQQEEADDYVISTEETHTVEEFANYVFDYAGLKLEKHLIIDERLFRPHEVPVLLGDCTKAKQKLGWKPKISFKNLAELMYEEDLSSLSKDSR
jgi:GDPmannose 4,6-dehydratase